MNASLMPSKVLRCLLFLPMVVVLVAASVATPAGFTDGTRRLGRFTHWRAGTPVPLVGEVRVPSGGTLVIDAGTRLEASPGARLVVERGATIFANGTSLRPIVLTCIGSVADPLLPPGCWGGVVLQGFAPINGGTPTSPVAPGNGLGGCNELESEVAGGRAGGVRCRRQFGGAAIHAH